MKEYVVLPSAALDDADLTAAWIRRGAEYAASLPPKAKKAKARKPAARSG